MLIIQRDFLFKMTVFVVRTSNARKHFDITDARTIEFYNKCIHCC